MHPVLLGLWEPMHRSVMEFVSWVVWGKEWMSYWIWLSMPSTQQVTDTGHHMSSMMNLLAMDLLGKQKSIWVLFRKGDLDPEGPRREQQRNSTAVDFKPTQMLMVASFFFFVFRHQQVRNSLTKQHKMNRTRSGFKGIHIDTREPQKHGWRRKANYILCSTQGHF